MKGALTSVNPHGESLVQASMVHLSQEDKPQKMALGVQPQLSHAVDHVSMVAQGVKRADKLSKTPLCEHISKKNTFKFLKMTKVFNKQISFHLKSDPNSDYPGKLLKEQVQMSCFLLLCICMLLRMKEILC